MLLLMGLFVMLLVLRVPVGFALFGSSMVYLVANGIPWRWRPSAWPSA